jgi:alpha-tubulin suppressor-like RCC1 family protein
MTRKIVISASAIVMAASFTPVAHPAQLTGSVVEWGDAVIPLVDPQTRFKSIASGYEAAFGLTTDGQLIGWHWNFYHEIPPFGHATNIIAVSAATHTLALKRDGTVLAWGDNSQGQCDVPPGLSNVVAISAANGVSLALQSDQRVAAWGWNSYGGISNRVPTDLSNVVAIAAGRSTTLALKSDGTVFYFGNYTNTTIAGLSNIVAIAGDPESWNGAAWALDSSGRAIHIYSEGSSLFKVEFIAGISNIVAVADGGDGETLFLQSDGAVRYLGVSQIVSTGATAVAAGGGGLFVLKINGSLIQFVSNLVPQPPSWAEMQGG